MLNQLAPALLLCPLLGSCALHPHSRSAEDVQVLDGLTACALGATGDMGGITHQVDTNTGHGDYSLLYRVTDDGQAIRTRFLGPSEAVGAALRMSNETDGAWQMLVCQVVRSDYRVTLAKWKIDDEGRIIDLYTRNEPFVEWRALGLKEYQLVTRVEWRPLTNGKGVGEWRRQ